MVFTRFKIHALAAALAAFFLLAQSASQPAQAQQTPTQQTVGQLNAFLATNPTKEQLTAYIRDLALNNQSQLPGILASIINVGQSLNSQYDAATGDRKKQLEDQLSAIGAGLGQAALALAPTNQDLANQIQLAIADSGVDSIIKSYAASTGNTLTAAAGGGNGGPTGGNPAPISGGGGGSGGNSQAGASTGGTVTGGGGVNGGGGNNPNNPTSSL